MIEKCMILFISISPLLAALTIAGLAEYFVDKKQASKQRRTGVTYEE